MTQKWQHPTMGEITLTDRRSSATTAPVDVRDTPEYKHLAEEMATTPAHEARHAAVSLFWDFKTVQARADLPEDHILGNVTGDFSGETWTRARLAEYMSTIIAGPLGDKSGPPAWPLRLDDGMASEHSDEKTIARIAADLKLNQKQYEQIVEITRTILENPGVKRAIGHIETLLDVAGVVDGRMLRDLYKSGVQNGYEEALLNATPPTTEELEHRVKVEEHRAAMSAYLEACDWYRKEEADKALRRKAERLIREIEAGS